MKSITITLTGNSATLSSHFHPEIELNGSYSCCLVEFSASDYMILTNDNNKFHYQVAVKLWPDEYDFLEVPIGVYKFVDVVAFIEIEMRKRGYNIKLVVDTHTMRITIEAPKSICIDFTKSDSIGSLLGFDKEMICGSGESKHHEPHIHGSATMRINCDLITGSFLNGVPTRTLHEFIPQFDSDYKIIVQPKNLIYLPIVSRRMNSIHVTVVDQNGKLISLRGYQISCRIHIKRDETC